ncbi:MAG: hypothetical protein QW607_05115 [Desulfurococcaceae archaeon]
MIFKRDSIVLIIMILAIFLYIYNVGSHSKPRIDIWVYSNIYPLALVIYALIIFLGYLIELGLTAKITIVSILLLALHVLTPLVKYSSDFYNPFDTQSHIVFSQWIALNGRVPINGEVYYSREYGWTPLGNGVLPAVFKLITNIDMQEAHTILFIAYLTLLILVTLSLMKTKHSFYTHELPQKGFWLFLVHIFLLSILYLPEWWGSPVFASIPAYLVIYGVYRSVVKKNSFIMNAVPSLIMYASLVLIHILIAFYVIIILLLSMSILLIFRLSGTENVNNGYKKIRLFLAVFLTLYFVINLYYVITWENYLKYLYEKIFGSSEPLLPHEMNLYFQRSPELTKVLSIGLGAYGKVLAVLVLSVLISVYVLVEKMIRRSTHMGAEWLLESLLIGTSVINLLTITVFFNRFEALVRSTILTEGILIAFLSYRLLKLRSMSTLFRLGGRRLSILFAGILICFSSFMNIANYGVPTIIPETRVSINGNELVFTSNIRTYVVSPLLISSAQFLNEGVQEYVGVIVSPFYPRNYLDYFWNKIERYEIFAHFLFIDEFERKIIESIPKFKNQIVIPMATSWEYVPIGSINLDYPFMEIHVRLASTNDLIYNNDGVRVYLVAKS